MAWTYTGNPALSPLDAVRFEVQDTNEAAQLLTDEEVVYVIDQESGERTPYTEKQIIRAAARCLEVLDRKFAARADTVEGSLRVTYSKQAKQYAERAKELRKRAAGMNAPWTGGTTASEREARENNTSEVPALFRKGQFNIPYQGPQAMPWPVSAISEEER